MGNKNSRVEYLAPNRPSKRSRLKQIRGVLMYTLFSKWNGHCSDRSVARVLPKAWTVLSLGGELSRQSHAKSDSTGGRAGLPGLPGCQGTPKT